MVKIVSVYEAKTQLSALIDEVLAGGEVVITRHGKPVVEIVPSRQMGKVQLGAFSHLAEDFEDFDIDAIDISHMWKQWEENNRDLGK